MNLLHMIARSWRQRPARTALSIASVAIAVAAVLGTALAQSSVRLGVARLTGTLDEQPALEIVSLAGGRLDAEQVPDVSTVPGVAAAIPLVNRATLARVHGKRFRTVLLGLPLGNAAAWQALPLVEGEACREEGEAILAAELAKSLGAKVGDRLVVITRRGPKSATLVGFAKSELLGEFAPGASIAMPLAEVQGFFGLEGKVDRVRILARSADQRDAVMDAVAARLPNQLVVQTPMSATATIDATLQSTELALRLAGALSMAMAAFIILNTLRLNFSERRRDVAVVRVLGATERQIVALHLAEGVALGGIGAALGLPLGIWLGSGLRQAMAQILEVEIPAPQMPYGVIAVSLLLGPAVAALAALVPALQSRRVSPIEALGEMELRRREHFPRWAVATGVVAWCAAVSLVVLVMREALPPEAAIPAGLLMLVAFISVIPAVVGPVVNAAVWLLGPWFATEGRLAGDQLLARSTRSGLTVGVLVVALSAGLGLGTAIINNVNDVRDWYRRSLTGDVFVSDPAAADETATSEQRNIAAKIAADSRVKRVVEMRLLAARANGLPAMCIVRDFLPNEPLPWSVPAEEEAGLRNKLKAGEAAMSSVMAKKLGLHVGDEVRVEVQGRVLSVPICLLVNEYLLGGLVAYLDREPAEKMVSLGPAEFFLVEARPGASTEQLAQGLQTSLADEGLVIQSFAEMRRQLDGLIDGVVGALWALLSIGFLIGGVAVSNTLTLNVLEQTRELGLLRIIGMTPRQVRKLVFCESLLLGILGALLGTLGGITTAVVIHVCNEPVLGRSIPFSLPAWLLAANAGGCLVIALLAAWRPSRRAANMNVLAAIAYE